MRDFIQDLKYAARSLRRTPAFTAAAVITLALGIGANSTIFTLLDAVMFKPLTLPHADQLFTLYENPVGPGAPAGTPDTRGGTGRFLRFPYPRYVRLQHALGNMGSLAAMTRSASFAIRTSENATQTLVRGQLVSANYFTVAGVTLARGRVFTDNEFARAVEQPVVIVSDGFWKRALGGSDAAIGRTVFISRVPVTVIGVAPPWFAGTWSDNEADIWMPVTMQTALGYLQNASSYGPIDPDRPWIDQDRIAWLNVFGRVDPASRGQATAILQKTNHDALIDMSLGVPDVRARQSITSGSLVVEPFERGFSGLRTRFSSSLLALAAMVAIVLLVACANIANLLLARSTARAREIGIRLSLGASRMRLVQQGLTESLLIAALGGGLGFAGGQWASTLIARAFLGSFNNPLPHVFSTDVRVLGFTAAISIVTALLFGVMPSLRATRVEVVNGLLGGRGVVAGSMMRGMRPLVAAQLALSFVVVFAAGLLGRSLINFSRVDPGYAVDKVVTMGFAPRMSGYTTDQLPALRDRLSSIARSVPGVTSAVISSCGLLTNCVQSGGYHLGPLSTPATQLNVNYVGSGFFNTVGIPLIRGREFTELDKGGAPRVAIVSESVASRYSGGIANAIGQPIGDDEFTAEIIGVVRDTRPLSLRDAPVPMVYFAVAQSNQQPAYTLTARVSGDARVIAGSIQQAFRRSEPALISDIAVSMDANIALATSRERLVAYLVAALGALALLLGCVGLYGVLSYAVSRRTQEFGVRVALGARPADLGRIVVKDAVTVIAAGTIIGLGVAVWANRLIQSLLFQVGTFDPLTGISVVAVLAGSALAACSLPAMRAARVDPNQALRAE